MAAMPSAPRSIINNSFHADNFRKERDIHGRNETFPAAVRRGA